MFHGHHYVIKHLERWKKREKTIQILQNLFCDEKRNKKMKDIDKIFQISEYLYMIVVIEI